MPSLDTNLFMQAIRAGVPERPDPAGGVALVPRLAEVARGQSPRPATPSRRAGRLWPSRPRLALAAKAAVAVGALVLSVAALAVAGVKLPAPAQSAFEVIGVNLPNQDSDSGAAKPTRGKSAAAHRRVLQRRAQRDATSRGKAIGHERGKAVGLRGGTPPGRQSNPSGPPAHSNAGGNGKAQSNGPSSHGGGKKGN